MLRAAGQGMGTRPGRSGLGVLRRPGAHRDAMISLLPRRARAADQRETAGLAAGSADWLRLAPVPRILSWLTLAWMGIEGAVPLGAAVPALPLPPLASAPR